MPILSNDNYDADVVHDLQDLTPVIPAEAAEIIDKAEGLENVNNKIRKHLNRAGGTARNAARTLVDLMCNGKDNVRLTAAVKVLELHGAEFKQASAQPTLQVIVSSNNTNLGAIFNPRRNG